MISLPAILLMAAAARPFHLTLEANPAAPFPFLNRFGTVTLDVYPGGLRADTFWLHGFSRNGSRTMVIENPLNRTYTEVLLDEIRHSLHTFSGPLPDLENARPQSIEVSTGTVRGLAARRFRMKFGPEAWIDVWTTSAVSGATQYRAVIEEFVSGISPATASSFHAIPGTPIYVELNFRRFKKVPVLRLKTVSFDNRGEEVALSISSFMFRAPFDTIFK